MSEDKVLHKKKNGFILNPVYIVFFIYISSNTLFFFQGVGNSGFSVFDNFYKIDFHSYLASYIGILFYSFSFFSIYLLSSHLRGTRNEITLSKRKSIFFIIYIIIYFLFFIVTGADVVGKERDLSAPGMIYLNYFFKVFSPDLISFLILPIIRSNRIFYFGLFVFLISMMLRGWMGGFYIAGLIYLIRNYPVRVSYSLLLIFCGFLFLLPVFNSIKWGIRGGYDVIDIVQLSINNYNLDSLIFSFESVIERFQHIDNVALIYQNSNFFENSFFVGEYRPFFMNGLPADIYCNLTKNCFLDLNAFLVESFYEPGMGNNWNVDPGAAGWLFISPILSISSIVFYLFIGCILPLYFLYTAGNRVYQMIVVFVFIYLLHGWVAPYINIITLAFIIIFYSKVTMHKANVIRNVSGST